VIALRRRRLRRPRANAYTVALTIAVLALTAGGSAIAAGRLNLLNVETQFMCVSCHEPLNTVSSPQAISEKQALSRLIAKGDDMQQITNTMVSYYGVQVLARPPASGVNLLIYILPPALLVSGLALLAFTLPRWRARGRNAAEAQPDAGAPLSPEQAARLDDELTNFI
jgi:cytochrome c-type biogenesis protein CcmH